MAKATHAPMWTRLKEDPRDRAQDILWQRTSHNARDHVRLSVRNPLRPIIRIMLWVENGMGNAGLTNLRF